MKKFIINNHKEILTLSIIVIYSFFAGGSILELIETFAVMIVTANILALIFVGFYYAGVIIPESDMTKTNKNIGIILVVIIDIFAIIYSFISASENVFALYSLIICIILIIIGAFITEANDKKKWRKEKQRAEKEKQINAEKFNNRKAELISKYGEPDKEIEIEEEDLKMDGETDTILIFDDKHKILIKGSLWDYKQILKVSYVNHKTEVRREIVPTHIKTSDVIGRGLVGGAIAGPIGAVIGGATARPKKSKTDIELELLDAELALMSDYSTIEIVVDDISNPLVCIELNNISGEDKAREILAVLQVIIEKNNKETDGTME